MMWFIGIVGYLTIGMVWGLYRYRELRLQLYTMTEPEDRRLDITDYLIRFCYTKK